MPTDPNDPSTWTLTEVRAYNQLHQEAAAAAALKDPANAPGQLSDEARANLPLGEAGMGVPPPAPNVYPGSTNPNSPVSMVDVSSRDVDQLSRIPGMGAAKLFKAIVPPDELRPDPKDDAATARRKSFALQRWLADSASKRVHGESAGASTLLGGPLWSQFLNAATTQTPADLGTSAALGVAGKVLDGAKALQFGNRAGNAASGAAKSLAQYEGGTRLHALLNGDQQPSNDLTKRNPWDLAFETGAGVIGGAAGYKAVPAPGDPQAAAKDLFQAHNQKRINTENQIADLHSADEKARAAETAAKRAYEDAKLRLARHEELMAATAKDAKGKTAQEYQSQAARLRVEEQGLKDAVTQASEAHTAASNALTEHQKQIQGVQQFSGNITANNLSDQILTHENQLDAWKNKSAPTASAPTAEELDLSDKIKAIQEGLDGGTWRGAVKAAKTRQLNAYQKSLEGYSGPRSAADAQALGEYEGEGTSLRQKLRELKDQRTRVLGGRTVETDPTDIVQMHDDLARKTADTNSSASALNQLRERYNASRIQRLSHAGSPTAPTNSQGLVQDHQRLMDAADEATGAIRQAQDVRQGIAQQTVDLNGVLTKLKNSTPPEPKSSAAKKAAAKTALLSILPLLGGGAEAAMFHHGGQTLGTIAGVAGGGLLSYLGNTEAGRKLLNFLYENMAKNGPKVIPAAVNQGARFRPAQ